MFPNPRSSLLVPVLVVTGMLGLSLLGGCKSLPTGGIPCTVDADCADEEGALCIGGFCLGPDDIGSSTGPGSGSGVRPPGSSSGTTTDPDATPPGSTLPDVSIPDASDPDATDPDATDPDATDPGGTGGTVCITSDLASLDFGPVGVGSQRSGDLEIRNCGDDTIRRATLTRGDPAFEADLPGSPFPVEPGDLFTVRVQFTPFREGAYVDRLIVRAEGDSGEATLELRMRGEGVAVPDGERCLRLTPAELDFGRVAVDDPPQTRQVQVANCGRVPLDLGPVAELGDGAFTATLEDSDDARLVPGESTTLQVRFDPGAGEGTRLEVFRLTVFSDTGRLPVRAVVTPAEQPPPGRCVEPDPTAVTAPRTVVGESASVPLRLRNCADAPVELRLAIVAGQEAWRVQPPSLPLGGDETDIVALLFQPVSAGDNPGLLRVTSDDDELLALVPLGGEGEVDQTVPCLRVDADVRTVTEGTPALLPVTIANCGTQGLRIVGQQIDPDGQDLASNLTLPQNLDPGASISATIAYGGGGTPGTRAVWELRASDGTTASLGVDIIPANTCIELTPAVRDLGEVSRGEQATGTLRVRNCTAASRTFTVAVVPEATPLGVFRLVQGTPASISLPAFASRDIGVVFEAGGPPGMGGAISTTLEVGELNGEARETATVRATVVDDPPSSEPPSSEPPSSEPPSTEPPSTEPPVVCVESLTGERLDFGFVEAGRTVRRTVEFRNCGTGTILPQPVLEVADTPAGSFRLGPQLPAPGVSPGSTFSLEVEGIAQQPGPVRGTLGVRVSEDADLLATVALAMDVVQDPPPPQPCVEISPSQRIDFGSVQPGSTVSRDVVVRNCGTVPVQYQAPRVRPQGTPFSTTGSGFTLAPEAFRVVPVRFTPASAGAFAAEWVLAPGGNTLPGTPPFVVRLEGRGTGIAPIPCAEFAPEQLDFGTLNPGQVREVTGSLINCGDTPLELRTVSTDDPRFTIAPNAGFDGAQTIPPGERVDGSVRFSSNTTGAFAATLEAQLDTVDGQALRPTAALTALVRPGTAPTPCLEVTPETIPFGDVQIGSSRDRGFILRNCGSTPLRLLGSLFVPSGGPFSLIDPTDAFAGQLAPGAERDGTVRFSPGAAGAAAATLHVDAMAPGGRDVRASISLAGVGIDDTPPPECRVPAPRATRTINGTNGPWGSPIFVRIGQEIYLEPAFDEPLADDETLTWSLTRGPAGAATLFRPENNRGRVSYTPTVAGEYRFRARYRKGDCTVDRTLDAIVTERPNVGPGLRVVITWRTPGDPDESTNPGSDVDLHFLRVREGQAFWNRSGDDVYYAARTADWGAPGPPNNPELLRDETQGLGPEVIVLPDPARNERFLVGIYYWSDRGFGHSDVTLRIFRDNVQLVTATRRLNQTGDFWMAADLILEGEFIRFPQLSLFSGFPAPSILP